MYVCTVRTNERYVSDKYESTQKHVGVMYVFAFVDAATSYLWLFCFGNLLTMNYGVSPVYIEITVMASTRACARWGPSRNKGEGVATH